MVLGNWRSENLSAAGSDDPRPPVRFRDTSVPARVAAVLEGEAGKPSARVEFEIRGDQPVCTSVQVTATAAGRGIRTDDLVGLPGLGLLADETFTDLASIEQAPGNWLLMVRNRAERKSARSDVRSGDRLSLLREVARVYRLHVDDHPAEAVRDMLGGVSMSTATRRISEARAEGLLPPTTKGKRKA